MDELEAQDAFHDQEAQQPAQGYGWPTTAQGWEERSKANRQKGNLVVALNNMDSALKMERDRSASLSEEVGSLHEERARLEKALAVSEQNRDFFAKRRDDLAEEARHANNYIRTLGAALGCGDGDTTPEERIKELIEEPGRWQSAIYLLLCDLLPHATIDGEGCDSDDPLDVTLTKIRQSVAHIVDKCGDVDCADRIAYAEERTMSAYQERDSLKMALRDGNAAHKKAVEELYAERERIREMRDVIASLVIAAKDSRCECAEEPEGTDCIYCLRRSDAIRAGEKIMEAVVRGAPPA